MKKLIIPILILVLLSGTLFSQKIVTVEIQDKSWIAINGSTNVLSFKLTHSGNKLPRKTINTTAIQNFNKIYLSENQLSLTARNFTSDNRMALRDFLKLIKSKTYPTIEVQLNYFESISNDQTEDLYSKVNASVNITITGVTQQYKIPVSSSQQGDLVTILGEKKISIRDFGLVPPVEMMGLIKVSEWISIDFHMICKLTFTKASQGGIKVGKASQD